MADEIDRDQRTEAATPRRREEARERGQVALSTELVAAAGLGAGAALIVFRGGELARACGGLLERSLASLPVLGTSELTPSDVAGWLGGAATALLLPVATVVGPLYVVGALVAYGQVGLQLTPKSLEVDASRLDPLRGARRMLGARAFVRVLLAFLKIGFVGGAAAASAWTALPDAGALTGAELGPLLRGLGDVALRSVVAALVAIGLLALVDYLYQRYQHERDLKMTKQEVREELKSSEGDPHVRARIRRIQREMASRRMMADVPRAAVVVTNPTHYAVALAYDRHASERAPRLVAKGMDAIAQRIKEVARESRVPCVEDVVLARALHARVEIGQEIPTDLYQAVASVLAYVYRLQGGGQAA